MDTQLVIKLYQEDKLSLRVIAERVGSYPQHISRILAKNNIPLRQKSEAQKIALKTGRSKHPTEGKELSEDAKTKISKAVKNAWDEATPEKLEDRKKKSKENWDALTEEKKQEFLQKGNQAVREASVTGSKLEIFLADSLRDEGYSVVMHKKGLIPNDKLEVDLYLPVEAIAIEVDGPSHFSPIWGEEKLLKNMTADAKKGGLLNRQKIHLIRVKQAKNNVSRHLANDALVKVVAEIQRVVKRKEVSISDVEVGN